MNGFAKKKRKNEKKKKKKKKTLLCCNKIPWMEPTYKTSLWVKYIQVIWSHLQNLQSQIPNWPLGPRTVNSKMRMCLT
jgi:hypothetical protein